MDTILMYRDAGIVWTALVDKKTKKQIVHIVCEGKRQERFETHLLAKQRVEWLQEVRRAGSVEAALFKRKQGAVAVR